jgi:hypothetical protein
VKFSPISTDKGVENRSEKMKVCTVIPYAYGKGTAKGSLNKLYNHLRLIDRVREQYNYRGRTILVDATSPMHKHTVFAIAKSASPGAEIIAGDTGYAMIGHNRLRGLQHAFKEHEADVAIVQNSDGHHDARSIPDLVQQLVDKEADLAVGVRQSLAEVTEALLRVQIVNELRASREIVTAFDWHDIMMPQDGTQDFLSGCSAYSKKGWRGFLEVILPHIGESDPLGRPAGFDLGMPTLFHAFGLKVIPVGIKINSRIVGLSPVEVEALNQDPAVIRQKQEVLHDAEVVINYVKALVEQL